jgi:Domain of unknown function (DUF397)
MDNWRKSSYSGANGGSCVETASADGTVHVRDTTDRARFVLPISADAWREFTSGLKTAELDPLTATYAALRPSQTYSWLGRSCILTGAATVTACGTAHTVTATKPHAPTLAEDLVHNLGTAG